MPKKEKVMKSSIDRISSMPNEILCHILSFLPTKYAVGTSILSTRWKYLFASLPDLDLDDSLLLHPFSAKEYGRSDSNALQQLMILHREYDRYIENQMLTFTNFVYRVLLIRNISYIRKFSLKFKEAYDTAHINTWICSAIWRSVEQLCLQITWNSSITLPRELFRCDTLVVLKLGSYFALDVPSCVLFPRLKILDLNRIVIKGDDVIRRLFAGCPVIETVAMFSCELHDVHVLDISVTALKSLTLHSLFGEDERCDFEIMVNAPLLEYFKHIGNVVSGYSVTNLDSLVEAHIDVAIVEVTNAELGYCGQLVANLVAAISNVKVLYLSGETMKAFKHSNCWLPTFPNLTHLELGANDNVGWSLLPALLKSSYNLEKLAFVEGFTDQSDCCDTFTYCLPERVPVCLLLYLKDIKIRGFTGREDELKLVEYFLKSARVLNKMTIEYYSLSGKQQLCVSKKILAIPRQSKACQIVLTEKRGQKKRF